MKILFKDRSKALVQFRDAEQAANAMRFLNGVPVGGKPLRIMPSMLTEVQLPLTDSMVWVPHLVSTLFPAFPKKFRDAFLF